MVNENIFQTKKLNTEEVLESFASKNKNSGAVISFLEKSDHQIVKKNKKYGY